ncbi:MAG: hypothetical protein AB8B63_19360 [Granulosicoccus sp.]
MALNVPAANGEIETIKFLDTPNVLENPWPTNPKVLATWQTP